MTADLLHFVREQALIPSGVTVTCAVSGGADSMAMLWALYRLRETLNIHLRCAHFNHGLRPAAAQEEAFVREFCAQHEIPFVCDHGDVTAHMLPGESLELAARRLRYAFLRRAADGSCIATAHTSDDNLETLLLRLTRGTSPRGLGGIPAKQGDLIRPILFATRAQVLDFLHREGIDFCEDESNQADFCPRNRLRHHVVPLLREENPQIAAHALSLSRTVREEDAYLSGLAADALRAAYDGSGYDCTALRQLPKVLYRRALFAILQQAGVATPTEQHFQQLHALVSTTNPSARANFPADLVLARQYTRLLIETEATTFAPTALTVPGITEIPALGLKISCSAPKRANQIENFPTTFLLRCDMIDIGSLCARPRQTGDRIQLQGGSRSLKRLMIDRKIPAAQRSRVLVLADAGGVIAVGGIGADLRRLARSGDKAIQIQIENEEISHA